MKKKQRVYEEEVKTRHTAHWDWDYLTWEEIEHRLKEAGVKEDEQKAQNKTTNSNRRTRYGIWIGFGLLIVALLVIGAIIR
jgi:uncharacterized membrane protein YukC